MIEIETGLAGLDALPKQIGAINGIVEPKVANAVAMYVALASCEGAGVVVSLAGAGIDDSTPVGVNAAFLAATGYADLEGWIEATEDDPDILHPDDVHTFATRCATQCAGDLKLRIKGAGGPDYVRLHVQMVHLAVGGLTYRVMLTQSEA